MALHLPSRDFWHPFSAVKPVSFDYAIASQNQWGSLTFSLLLSLVVHAIVVANVAFRTDDSRVNRTFIHSSADLLVRVVLDKHQPTVKSASPIPWPVGNAVEKPVAPDSVAPPTEEISEESPYASPDSIEQMASIIDPLDLPLPPDSFSVEGFMRIKVFVNEEGFADNVELLESNFAEDYASTLVVLFKSAKFSPGLSGGRAIKSWRIVEIDYSSS